MHRRLVEITRDLETCHRGLLQAYDPRLLYKLRVALRRIRSILKLMDNHRSRGLRKAWGGFAALTGKARDWDVFLETAEDLLGADGAADFASVNGEHIRAGRSAVSEMLASALWQRQLEDWNRFLQDADDPPIGTEAARAAMAVAVGRAQRRHRRAMAQDEDRRWHKYRIAVKEMRYLAEACVDVPGMAAIAAACKPLQTLLGEWHDTVVQLNLLDELPPAAVHTELAALIVERQAALLSRIRNSPAPDQPVW